MLCGFFGAFFLFMWIFVYKNASVQNFLLCGKLLPAHYSTNKIHTQFSVFTVVVTLTHITNSHRLGSYWLFEAVFGSLPLSLSLLQTAQPPTSAAAVPSVAVPPQTVASSSSFSPLFSLSSLPLTHLPPPPPPPPPPHCLHWVSVSPQSGWNLSRVNNIYIYRLDSWWLT